MNARALLAAALAATFGGAADCIDEGYDPLQPGRYDAPTRGWSEGIDVPGAPERRGVRVWHDARAATTADRPGRYLRAAG